jgi:hypothetical protein
VIIFGTGYSLVCIHKDHAFLTAHCSRFIKGSNSLNVQGSGGNTISEYFESKGGAQAYLGSCYPGFPNLFTLLGKLPFFRAGWIVCQCPPSGPNVASGHASVIFSEEAQVSSSQLKRF